MNEDFIYNGKKYISSKQASKVTGYTSDYIGQLCRGGKVEARRVGRSWFIAEESILNYEKEISVKVSEMAEARLRHPTQIDKPAFESGYELLKYEPPNKTNSEPLIPPINKPKEELKKTQLEAEVVTKKISKLNIGSKDKNKYHRYPRMLSWSLKGMAVSVLLFTLGYGLGQGEMVNYIAKSFSEGQRNLATVISSNNQSEDDGITKSLIGSINKIAIAEYKLVNKIFGKDLNEVKMIEVPCSVDDVESCEEDVMNAIAVVPSTGSKTEDEKIKTTIQESFSDEVKIWSDENGTSGIIQPVFKKSVGDKFIYMMVPVDKSN